MLKLIEVLRDALDAIGQLVERREIADASEILDAIGTIYKAVDKVADERVDPDAVRAELRKLVAELLANDTAADAALDSKFPSSDD